MSWSEDMGERRSRRGYRPQGYGSEPLHRRFDDWEERLERHLRNPASRKWLYFAAGLLIGLILG